MNNRYEALIRASGFYLTTHLTEELLAGDIKHLDDFLENNKWEPFEQYTFDQVWVFIDELADSFEELMI